MTRDDERRRVLRVVLAPKEHTMRTIEVCEDFQSIERRCEACFGCMLWKLVESFQDDLAHEHSRVDVLVKRLGKLEWQKKREAQS